MRVLIAPFLMLFPLFGMGQHFAFGVKSGLNLSDIVITNYINPDAESDYTIKAGLHAGVFASADLDSKLLLASELLYSNKGVVAGKRINLHYINLPMLVQYKLTDKFLIEGGPELGYLFSAKSEGENVGNTWNNKLDVGFDLGVGYNFNNNISVGARYNVGFLSVIETLDESNSNLIPGEERIKYQNRVLQFSVSYVLLRKAMN